jgi:hypothetical protein
MREQAVENKGDSAGCDAGDFKTDANLSISEALKTSEKIVKEGNLSLNYKIAEAKDYKDPKEALLEVRPKIRLKTSENYLQTFKTWRCSDGVLWGLPNQPQFVGIVVNFNIKHIQGKLKGALPIVPVVVSKGKESKFVFQEPTLDLVRLLYAEGQEPLRKVEIREFIRKILLKYAETGSFITGAEYYGSWWKLASNPYAKLLARLFRLGFCRDEQYRKKVYSWADKTQLLSRKDIPRSLIWPRYHLTFKNAKGFRSTIPKPTQLDDFLDRHWNEYLRVPFHELRTWKAKVTSECLKEFGEMGWKYLRALHTKIGQEFRAASTRGNPIDAKSLNWEKHYLLSYAAGVVFGCAWNRPSSEWSIIRGGFRKSSGAFKFALNDTIRSEWIENLKKGLTKDGKHHLSLECAHFDKDLGKQDSDSDWGTDDETGLKLPSQKTKSKKKDSGKPQRSKRQRNRGIYAHKRVRIPRKGAPPQKGAPKTKS